MKSFGLYLASGIVALACERSTSPTPPAVSAPKPAATAAPSASVVVPSASTPAPIATPSLQASGTVLTFDGDPAGAHHRRSSRWSATGTSPTNSAPMVSK
jgi:hypothetical protein